MKITINWDLDGTLADLYNYDGWLELLQKQVSPFAVLKKLKLGEDFSKITKALEESFEIEFKHRIITWLPMIEPNQPTDYRFLTVCAGDKKHWTWKEIGELEVFCLPYGTPKESLCRKGKHILVDDNPDIVASFPTKRSRKSVQVQSDVQKTISDLFDAVWDFYE